MCVCTLITHRSFSKNVCNFSALICDKHTFVCIYVHVYIFFTITASPILCQHSTDKFLKIVFSFLELLCPTVVSFALYV